MSGLSPAALALWALLAQRHCVPEPMIPVMVGIALNENPTLNPNAINVNKNGSRDLGVAQVNTSNFGWTGLTEQNWRDPCANIAAAMKVYFARYNGNPPDVVKARYAAGVIRRLEDLPIGPSGSVPVVVADATPAPFQRPSRTSASMTFAPPDRKD